MNRSRQLKQIFPPILISLFSILLTFLLLEGTTRLSDLAPPLVNQYRNNVSDPHLPYKPRPGSELSGRSAAREFSYLYQHNSFGFRDVEHAYEKEEGVFRILGLGDSFTYGIGARFEETYLYRLEEMLNDRPGNHPRIEIIKTGIPRYFPEPERILLDKYGRKYSPDLVLVGFVANDVIDTFQGMDAVVVDESGYLKSRESKEIGTIGVFLYQHSHLFRLTLQQYIASQISKKPQPRWGQLFRDDGYHEKDWQTVEGEYAQIVSIAEEIDSEIALLRIPRKGPWNEDRFYASQRLGAWALARNVEFIDALPSMIKATETNDALYYPKDGHCTPDGYAVIAQVLYEHLTEKGLVP